MAEHQQQTAPPPVVLVGLTQAECAFVLGRLDPNGASPVTCALYAKMASAWLELRARDAVESAAAQMQEKEQEQGQEQGQPAEPEPAPEQKRRRKQ